MGYVWDPAKADSNLEKHGVDFADAVGALEDEMAVTIEDELTATDEQRYVTIGMDPLGILVTIFTWRGEQIRIISSRPATRPERRQYEG